MQGRNFSLFATASRLSLGPIQPPIQSVSGTVFLWVWVKWLGHDADHSHSSSAKVNGVILPHLHSAVFN